MSFLLRPALLFAALCLLPFSAQSRGLPNVILFLVDDMGWADWEHDGRPSGSSFYETPSMNRLAREGVSFDHAYSSASVCSPTRNALLTGMNPARSRMTNWLPGSSFDSTLSEPPWSHQLDRDDITLAEAFRNAGYATAFVGKWHLGEFATASANPLLHGFDINVGGTFLGGPNPAIGYFANTQGSFGLPGLGPGKSVPGDYLTDRITDVAVEFIEEKASEDEPFFLFFSHYGVHIPLSAPPDLVSKYQAKPTSGGHTNATYAAMLETVDTSLGRVLDALENAGIREETIVVFTSDNGGSLQATSNSPLRSGKGFAFEGGIRVPLIVSVPGDRRKDRNVVRDAVVVSHDIYPTLLELTGVSGDPVHNREVDGRSFENALERDNPDCRATFWHYPHISPQSRASRGGRYFTAVRVGEWKAIYFYEEESWELYHLGSDVGETTNLLDTAPGIASAMGNLLVAWLVDIDAQLPLDASTGLPVALPSPVIDQKRSAGGRDSRGFPIPDRHGCFVRR